MIYKNERNYYYRYCWYSCSSFGAIIRQEIIYDKTRTAEELNLLFRATVLHRLVVVVVSVVVVLVAGVVLPLRVSLLRQSVGGVRRKKSYRFSQLSEGGVPREAEAENDDRDEGAEDKSLQKLINRIGKYLWFPSSTSPTYCNGYINNNNSLPYDNPR